MEARLRRVSEISVELGFVGSVEYRHVYSRSGGAQYCVGLSAADDIMVVYAEAFEREADPEDFALEAMIAHECGHQRIIRDSKVRTVFEKLPSDELEEILASLVGSVLLGDTKSAQTLLWKAFAELGDLGMSDDAAVDFVVRMQRILGQLL
jgi:hypothetical protein